MFGLDSRMKNKIRIEPKAELDENIYKTIYDVEDFAYFLKMNGLQISIENLN